MGGAPAVPLDEELVEHQDSLAAGWRGRRVIDVPSPGTSFCSTGIEAGWFAGLVKASLGQPWNVIGEVPWFVAASRPRPGTA